MIVGGPRVENRPLPYFVNQSFDIPPAQRYSYYIKEIKKTQQTGQADPRGQLFHKKHPATHRTGPCVILALGDAHFAKQSKGNNY